MKLTLILVAMLVAAGGSIVAFSRTCPFCHDRSSDKAPKETDGDCCEPPTRAELVSAFVQDQPAGKSDCLLFGGSPQRNLVNLVDKNVPIEWSIEEGKEKNIKWIATLGDKSYGGPLVANGKIYVGTNNGNPRDPKIKGHKAILMALNEADGKFLWQIVHDIPADPLFNLGRVEGLCSTPVIEGDNLYYVTPGCEVVRATTAGKVDWTYDMMKELKVVPFHLANCSPLIAGDLVMLMTSNGTDEQGEVPSPKAPSFIAVNKKTGKLAWQNSLPGDRIIEGQWANPALATVNGKNQVIFPGGDGVLYSFEAETGKLIWKFDGLVARPKKGGDRVPTNYFVATPVIYENKLYIGMGVGPDLGTSPKSSYLFCIDLTKSGDVSPKSYKANDPANKDSALIWAFGGPIEPRPKSGPAVYFSPTINTCAIHDGLVYAVEERGFLHCLDAKTGERYWYDDLKTAVWGSPYYVDNKVFVGCQDGSVFIFAHGKTKKQITTIDHLETIDGTPLVANGVLYITTRSKLIAVVEKK
jgi:outer membrane protein assembly factor BamB